MKTILKNAIGLILWVLAVGLIIPLTIVNFVLVWVKYKSPSGYFLDTATSLDRWANREFRTLWNTTLITPLSLHRFGDSAETISSVLGKNQQTHTLTTTGNALAHLLDFLDKNHCKNSIYWHGFKENVPFL